MSELALGEEFDSINRFDSDKKDDSETEAVDEDRQTESVKKNRAKPYTKKTHSDIEKRRRDKMNTYINELSTMIPMCNTSSRKLDKLTVLKRAVQHMKSLRGKSEPLTETKYKPAFLSDEDLKYLILDAAEGYLLVVSCDRGCILYVSDNVSESLDHTQSDLVGDSFFDLVHPKDVGKVKEQLMCPETVPREQQPLNRIGTTAQPKAEVPHGTTKMSSGSRRSFFCRMKKTSRSRRGKDSEKDTNDLSSPANWKSNVRPAMTADSKQYEIVYLSGFLKSWPASNNSFDEEDDDADPKSLSCLVCVCRLPTIYDENTDYSQPGILKDFVSRHSVDGKYIHVEHSMTIITGWLPQELIGRSAYDFIGPENLASIASFHKNALLGESLGSPVLNFRCKAGHYIPLRSEVSVFSNPCTKEAEFIICKNQVLSESDLQNLAAESATSQTIVTGADGVPPSVRLMTIEGAVTHGVDRIGTMVLEEVEQQRAKQLHMELENGADVEKRRQSPSHIAVNRGLGKVTTLETGAQGLSPAQSSLTVSYGDVLQGSPAGQVGLQTSSVQRINTGLSGLSSAPPTPPQETKRETQPYLLEQLIGMQDAIEAMESIAPHNEHTMSAFMNLLMSDTEIFGEDGAGT